MAPINIRIITLPPPAFHSLYRVNNYRSLQEIINSSASLSPNEATRIIPSADGDVVRLITALPSCVRCSSVDVVPAFRVTVTPGNPNTGCREIEE